MSASLSPVQRPASAYGVGKILACHLKRLAIVYLRQSINNSRSVPPLSASIVVASPWGVVCEHRGRLGAASSGLGER